MPKFTPNKSINPIHTEVIPTRGDFKQTQKVLKACNTEQSHTQTGLLSFFVWFGHLISFCKFTPTNVGPSQGSKLCADVVSDHRVFNVQ